MAVPTLVQWFHTANSQAPSTAESVAFHVPFQTKTLSGNCLVLFFGYAVNAGTVTWTVADDQTQSWTQVVIDNNATDGYNLACFIFPNTVAGAEFVTATIGGGGTVTFFEAWVGEFNNIATTSPQDVAVVHQHVTTSTTALSPGAMTTVTNGDLIVTCVVDSLGTFPQTTGFTKGTNFTLASADIRFGMAVQYQVQATAGAITSANMAVTSPVSTHFIAIGIALKNAAAGTAPTADPRIRGAIYCDFKAPTGTTVVQQFIPVGNAIAVLWLGASSAGATRAMSAISDGTNTYTRSAGHGNGSSGLAQVGYSLGSTPGSYLVTVTTTADNVSTFVLVDLTFTNAQFDQVAGSTGVQSVAGDLTVGSITPSRANGVLLNVTGINAGTLRNQAGSWLSINPWAGSEAGGGNQFHQDNGWSSFFPTTTSSTAPDYHNSQPVGGVLDWGSETLSLVPPASGGTVVDRRTLRAIGRVGTRQAA